MYSRLIYICTPQPPYHITITLDVKWMHYKCFNIPKDTSGISKKIHLWSWLFLACSRSTRANHHLVVCDILLVSWRSHIIEQYASISMLKKQLVSSFNNKQTRQPKQPTKYEALSPIYISLAHCQCRAYWGS